MISPSDTIITVAPYFKPYIELEKIAGEVYYFRKESTALIDSGGNKRIWHPRIEHRMLREFHASDEGLLYIALPQSATLNCLKPSDLLYIGCSASGGARFWRGKLNATTRFPTPKSCFHHEQMRRGRDGLNLESYLLRNGPIRIHTLTSNEVETISRNHGIPLPDATYLAHKLEKRILMDGFTKWAWNKRT
jgi:hypothetical protein